MTGSEYDICTANIYFVTEPDELGYGKLYFPVHICQVYLILNQCSNKPAL